MLEILIQDKNLEENTKDALKLVLFDAYRQRDIQQNYAKQSVKP